MEKFVNEHLRELCAELVEWQDTGRLRQGRLRELAALCTFDPNGHIRLAERMTERAAIRAIADDGEQVTDEMVNAALQVRFPTEREQYLRDNWRDTTRQMIEAALTARKEASHE